MKSNKTTHSVKRVIKRPRSTDKRSLAPGFAKISPPRLRNAYLREQLFQRLDESRDRTLIWLAAPAGYGKTTVVASWLQARQITAIWYQCDGGDADSASFFHFLSLAAMPLLKAPWKPLPRLVPELYPELATFVRNYFRELCSRLPAPTCIVLDNWQDLPHAAPLRELLPIAVNELPLGVTLVIVSRQDPEANLSRLATTGQMMIIGRDALQLSHVETAGVAALYEPIVGQRSVLAVRELYAQSHGWAAGLTVLLRHEASTVAPRWDASQTAIQAVFDYLAAETFDRLELPIKEFLMKTACLEHITAPVAQQLTGITRATDILDTLVRNNVFTQQRPATGTYNFHPLFKQFLQSRAAAHYSVAQQRDLLNAAASALKLHDDPEAAIALLLRAGNWPEAAQLILSLAPALVAQGRFATLSDLMTALPESLRGKHAWLMYWHGIQQLARASPAARVTLEGAFELFRDAADGLGQMLAISAILQHHYFGYADLNPMLPWISTLEKLLLEREAFPSPTVELSVVTGLFSALMLCTPGSPRLIWCADVMAQLMLAGVDLRAEAAAIAAMLHHYATTGQSERTRELVGAAERLAGKEELGPALRLEILWMHGFYLHLIGEESRCAAILTSAIAIARHHNLAAYEHRLRVSIIQSTSAAAQSPALAEEFARMEPMAATMPPLMAGHDAFVRAMFCLSRGELEAALRYATRAKAVGAAMGWKGGYALITLGMAEVVCEMGHIEEAEKNLAQCRQIVAGVNTPLMVFSCGLVEAEIARRKGEPGEFREKLREVFAVGREQGYASAVHATSIYLPRLIPFALELGIEVEYCLGVIRKRAIQPPARDIAAWPWPVRIRALGHFEVWLDGEPIQIHGRPQHKPLDLLKSLLVQRDGVDCGLLMERLWPDLDGDAARNALDLALHRLRKLLKHKDTLILEQGRLQLEPSHVWVDAFVLDRLCAGAVLEKDPATEAQQLLRLYTGAFLADLEHPWIFEARERRRSAFIRRVGTLGKLLQEQRCWEPLTDLYRRAIEIDPLAEEFYRGLMRCFMVQGRGPEARATYLRCAEALARLLGTEPSALSRTLYESL